MPENFPILPRLMITAALLAYGLGPVFMDLNKTHLRHPAWPGHARFHLLWAVISQLAVSGIAIWLVWSRSDDATWRCRLGAIIGLCLVAGFWAALIPMKRYQGALHDPGGYRPISGKVDGNLLAVIAMTALLLCGLFSF